MDVSQVPRQISPGRRKVVFAWLWFLILGQAIATTLGQELWPFSPYPMYARIRYTGEVLEEVQIRRVFVLNGQEREETMHNATLRTRARLILRQNRLTRPDGSKMSPRERREVWDRYLRQDLWFPFRSPVHSDRQAGLVGIRAYLLTYENDAKTFDPDEPNKRELLGETMRGRARPATTRPWTGPATTPSTRPSTRVVK